MTALSAGALGQPAKDSGALTSKTWRFDFSPVSLRNA
jgi:hypothetical protein